MRYLLDTHTLIWVAMEDPRLSPAVASLLVADPGSACVSAASGWEIATKNRLGKLRDVEALLDQFESRIESIGFGMIDITVRHSILGGQLKGSHGDPFDRILAAQALLENLTLLSNDRELDAFGVRRFW